jgi:hypothetical protein
LPYDKTRKRVGSSNYKTTDAIMSNSGGRNAEYAGMDLSN